MSAVDNVDQLIEQFHLAQGEFVKEVQASVYHVLRGLVETLVIERGRSS